MVWMMKAELDKLSKYGVVVGPSGLTATIHTSVDDIVPINILSVETVCDYVSNIGDYLYIELLMGLGSWTSKIYPYINNMEVTLTITNKDNVITSARYKAMFMSENNVSPTSTGLDKIDTDSLDIMSMTIVKLQLMDRCLEILRVRDCSGIYTDRGISDVLISELYTESQNVLVDNRPIVEKLLIDKVSNETVYKNIVIPDGTKLISLVDYIQKLYGVYNSGVGLYYTNIDDTRSLYMYSIYNTDKVVGSDDNKLKIITITDTPMSLIDKSYYVENNIITVFVGGESKLQSDGETGEMEGGTGFRLVEDRNMMSKPIDMTSPDVTASRRSGNYELSLKERDDGVNYNRLVKGNNTFNISSSIKIRMGDTVTVNWTYSDPSLLRPGMKIIYVHDDGEIRTRNGILIHTYTRIGKDRIPQTTMTLFVER